MAGLGDALKKEGGNMQKGLQDFHDMWMGQRPIPQQQTHSWGDWEPLGPADKTEEDKGEEKPAGASAGAVDVAVNPQELGPPVDGPAVYDPPIGPEPTNDNEPGM